MLKPCHIQDCNKRYTTTNRYLGTVETKYARISKCKKTMNDN